MGDFDGGVFVFCLLPGVEVAGIDLVEVTAVAEIGGVATAIETVVVEVEEGTLAQILTLVSPEQDAATAVPPDALTIDVAVGDGIDGGDN